MTSSLTASSSERSRDHVTHLHAQRFAARIVPPGRWDRIMGSGVHLDLTASQPCLFWYCPSYV